MSAQPNSVDYWAASFREQHVRGVEDVFELGRRFEECLEVAGDKILLDASSGAGYSRRSVNMIRAVSRCERMRSTTSHLPTGWYTLYALTTLTDEEWADALEAGLIHPNMTQADARKLRRPDEPPEVETPAGFYDVIVLDPPWDMKKIERDTHPEQHGFDYPTMTEDELRQLAIPAADDCHVWVWTTHKFLPSAFRLLDAWELKYVCTFVWHKPGGFQPFNLPQYNCEFALYARRGSPTFVNTKDFPVCIEAPRNGHSVKPDRFYEIVRRVTSGRRLDMFNRRVIEGFDGWGNESGLAN